MIDIPTIISPLYKFSESDLNYDLHWAIAG